MKHEARERTHGGRGGFSLIELLVIVAAVAILVALVLPYLGKLREKGRRALCKSNQRSLYIALFDYSLDHGGRFPTEGSLVEDYRVLVNHMGEAAGLLVCPSSIEVSAVRMAALTQANISYDYAEGLSTNNASAEIPLTRDKTRPADYGGWAPVHFKRGRREFGANVGFSDGHGEWYTNTVEALGTPSGAVWRLAGKP